MDPYSQLRHSYDTDLMILRSIFALNPDTNLPISTNYIASTDGLGGLVWQDPFALLSTAGPGVGYLPSTLLTLNSNVSSLSSLVSSLQIGLSSLSTAIGNAFFNTGIYTNNLTSTVEGLGSSQYISSTQLLSTVQGLGSAYYVSSSQLTSTVAWLTDPSRYVSTGALVSTTAGFLGNLNLLSTVAGLGTAGYISTATLQTSLVSTVNYISTFAYSTFFSTLQSSFITPQQLTSTVSSLGTLGYLSTANLVSTVSWFYDPSRYVSTGALVSTTAGISTNLQTTFYIDNAGNVTFYGGTAVFSTVQDVIFLSTFMFSSITYKGPRGTVGAEVQNTYDLVFSSATISLDSFSSYITNRSQINLDIYPTYVFDKLNTGATAYKLINMSSFIAYSNTFVKPTAESFVFAQNQATNFGNIYNQPIKMQIPGCNFVNKYTSPYVLCHYLTGGYSVGLQAGFADSNVEIQFASTNSLFLSVQNLP